MMEIITSRADLENRIVSQHAAGAGIRFLSRRYSMSRNTVRDILRGHGRNTTDGHDALPRKPVLRKSQLDAFIPKILEILARFPDIKAERLFEELGKEGYRGGRTILKERLHEIRPKPKKALIIRFETEPGIQGQMDWSPYKIKFRRIGLIEVLCFSYILGFSRRHFIDFTDNRKFPTMIRRHQDAFGHFGGVPRQCLYDGEKTVILRWEAGYPVFNPKFLLFITHYDSKPVACKPRTPRTKGKVEAPFQYVEGNLLNGRDFDDLEDLRQCARWWLAEKSDKHTHDTTGRPPIELFLESEAACLQPLPAHPYDTSEIKYLICNREGFCTFETNQYSVPARFIAEIMVLKATEDEIFIYSPLLDLVARHERLLFGAGGERKDPAHRATSEERYGVESIRDQFLALGDGAEEFLIGLAAKRVRSAGLWLRLILALKEHYNADDIAAALRHAVRYHAFDAKAIERILKAKARPRTLEMARNARAADELRSGLPKIEQRSLDDYNALLGKLEEHHDREEERRSRIDEPYQGASGDPEIEEDL
jgi:transposase